jgi:hypothetical protein
MFAPFGFGRKVYAFFEFDALGTGCDPLYLLAREGGLSALWEFT